jgi:phosphonopyruvate decarboxylase
MIEAKRFLGELRRAGFGLFSGVPCSYLTPLINAVIDDPDTQYIGAANEGEAVAIATGAQIGGVRGVAMFQNSGLGNAVSPLTSLNAVFRLPVLVITTWRGEPGGPADEPQHALMGPITPNLLELMQIPWEFFPERDEDIAAAVDRAVAHMDHTGTPYALVMRKGAVAAHKLQTRPNLDRTHRVLHTVDDPPAAQRLDVDAVLKTVQQNAGPRDVILATTGFTGRALYACDDAVNQFYMVGSMGCASSLGLGLARVQPERRVVVLDGDGAALMRLGALAILGHERPANLTHILLDNAVHDSTGAQATVSPTVDFATLAAACGYPHVRRIQDLDDLQAELVSSRQQLTFLHVPTLPRSGRDLPRPTVTPAEVVRRLQQWMGVMTCSLRDACAC